MTSLYSTYEDEMKDGIKEMQTDLADLKLTLQRDTPTYRPPPATGPGSRLQRMKVLSERVVQLRDTVLNMERECGSAEFPMQLREAARGKLQEYKKQFLQYERDLVKLKAETASADRADLIGNGAANSANGGAAPPPHIEGLDPETRKQHMQMAQNTATLGRGSKALREAEKLTAETEEMSNIALTTLSAQTNTISNIAGKTRDTDDELSQAKKILSEMHKEMIKNKAILLIIIGILSLLIIVVLYVKFGGSSSSESSTTTVIYVTASPGNTLAPPPTTTNNTDGNGF